MRIRKKGIKLTALLMACFMMCTQENIFLNMIQAQAESKSQDAVKTSGQTQTKQKSQDTIKTSGRWFCHDLHSQSEEKSKEIADCF